MPKSSNFPDLPSYQQPSMEPEDPTGELRSFIIAEHLFGLFISGVGYCQNCQKCQNCAYLRARFDCEAISFFATAFAMAGL